MDYYTAKQLAQKSGKSTMTIIRLIRSGVLEAEKPGRDWLIKKDSGDAWMKTLRK